MISRHLYRGGVWIDLEQATEDEIRQISEEFSIGKRIEREMLMPTPTPLVAVEGNATLLVLHFPSHRNEDGDTGNQEIDFVIGEHFIVTVRYEVIAPLYNLKKLLETQELVAGKDSVTTEVLLEILFAHLYTSVRDHTNHIAARLEHVETEMFDGHERQAVRTISNISREFLHIEAAIANQEEPLARFLTVLGEHGLFGTKFNDRTNRMLAERMQVARLVKTHRAVATELRETNTALLEVRQNDIIKMLTTITVIILPLELIAVTLHIPGAPLNESSRDFFMVIAGMFTVAGLMMLVFAKKRWIF